MRHTYEINVRDAIDAGLIEQFEIKGGAPRIALQRAMRKLSDRRNPNTLELIDFQLKKGESLTIHMRRIE